MPKPKSSASGKSAAKKIPKAGDKQKAETSQASIITDIVNSGLSTPVEDKLETVENVSSKMKEQNLDSNLSRKRVRCPEEVKHQNEHENKITKGKEESVVTAISKRDVDTEKESAEMQNKKKGVFAKLVDAMEEQSKGIVKERAQESSETNKDIKASKSPEISKSLQKKVESPKETSLQKADTYQRNTGSVANKFDSRAMGHQRGRGPFVLHPERFAPRDNYNQPIYPPGMEFQPYFPLHPQIPDPNFGQFCPFPPVYPTPDGQWPFHPQYGYPADGFVDPAWYFPHQGYPPQGMGHGQRHFTRDDNGRGRGGNFNATRGNFNGSRGNSSGREGYFNPRGGKY
ncbi:phage tail length tape-measure protein [Perkinsela sp. CCAP 1560/4]|nr:phage tail length tape-measure protein [Perkinsela sp. CCAP 1560/4]|eukprot:KNH04248.1 phage tail length tape-measure protein [Perkinsela sp. CCAP 1560/4]